jgi:hypothetical protein
MVVAAIVIFKGSSPESRVATSKVAEKLRIPAPRVAAHRIAGTGVAPTSVDRERAEPWERGADDDPASDPGDQV